MSPNKSTKTKSGKKIKVQRPQNGFCLLFIYFIYIYIYIYERGIENGLKIIPIKYLKYFKTISKCNFHIYEILC